ncbi:hypothetical protein BGX28_006973 [Mortierella sp. GBA30]|nr:hypothetical protein BGX28_006973 [Mortierella sp. GBA30]
MGRPVGRNLEDEMMAKIKTLFDRILETVNKENPNYTFDFEQFVDSFDENDHFTKRVFEFLVKETAQRYRSTHPSAQHSAQSLPHTIHHFTGLDNNSASTSVSNNSANANSAGSDTIGHSSQQRSYPSMHHHLPHHTLPALERDAPVRSSSSASGSPALNEGAGSSSSGAALRYLLSSQGLRPSGGRRSRIAHRMLSNDFLAYHQGQSSLLGGVSSLSSHGAQDATTTQGSSTSSSGSLGQSRNRESDAPAAGSRLGSGSGSLAEAGTGAASSSTTSSAPTSELRRQPRRVGTLDRQRAFIFRPPSSRTSDLLTSMETAPESFRTESRSISAPGTSFTSEIFDPSGNLLSTRPVSPEGRLMEQHSRQRQEQFMLAAQEFRQQQIRQLYIHTMQARNRQRHQPQQHQQQQEQLNELRTHHQHQQTLRTLQGERSTLSEDTQNQQQLQQQEQQYQQEPRYQLLDHGLMLVHPYPRSPSTPTPVSSAGSDPVNVRASQSTTSLSTLSSLPSEESYHEFSESTQRGRAAMRNALASELRIEEDHQVLLTGEVSRRRRRRVIGRFSGSSDSPDIGSDNSSAIISQVQQQQEQGQQAQQGQQDQHEQQDQQEQQEQQEQNPSAEERPVTSSLDITTQNTSAQPHTQQASLQHESQLQVSPLRDINIRENEEVAADATSSSADRQGPTTDLPLVIVSSEATANNGSTTAGSGAVEARVSRSDELLGQGLNPGAIDPLAQGEGHQPLSSPPTPPSPNPNRNPMPTFRNRRRSSINPADIEAVVREMEANAPIAASGRSTLIVPSSSNSRSRFAVPVLTTIAAGEEPADGADAERFMEDQAAASPRADSGQTQMQAQTQSQAHSQLLPSPPPAESDTDSGLVFRGTEPQLGSPPVQ